MLAPTPPPTCVKHDDEKNRNEVEFDGRRRFGRRDDDDDVDELVAAERMRTMKEEKTLEGALKKLNSF